MAKKRNRRGMGVYGGDEYAYAYPVEWGVPDFSDVQTGIVSTADTGAVVKFRAEFQQAVTNLDNAVAELAQRQQQLMALESTAAHDADDYAIWQTQMTRIDGAHALIENAQAGIAQATQWLRETAQTYNLPGLAGLGLAPLLAIPIGIIAVIAAATASIKLLSNSSAETANDLIMRDWQRRAEIAAANGQPIPPKPQLFETNMALSALTGAGKLALIGILAAMILPRLMGNKK